MVVNATIVFWEDLPPRSASGGQVITVTGRITNTGDEEQDFRMSVQMVGVGATIFPVPLEVWSSAVELSPNEIYTARAVFTMPEQGVQLTIQAEWFNRAGAPAQWVKVGGTATRNIALTGVTPQFPVQMPPTPATPAPLQAIHPMGILVLALLGGGIVIWLLTRKVK